MLLLLTRNLQDRMADGQTPFEKRLGKTFDGPVIPFGASVEYLPITTKDKSKIHPFAKEALEGVPLGHVLRADGGWSGDLRIVEICKNEQLQKFTSKDSKARR